MRLSDFKNRMASERGRTVASRPFECFAFLWRRRDLSNEAGLLARHDFQSVLIDVAGVPDVAEQLIVLPLADFGLLPLLALR